MHLKGGCINAFNYSGIKVRRLLFSMENADNRNAVLNDREKRHIILLNLKLKLPARWQQDTV